jgi:hypothetical protein
VCVRVWVCVCQLLLEEEKEEEKEEKEEEEKQEEEEKEELFRRCLPIYLSINIPAVAGEGEGAVAAAPSPWVSPPLAAVHARHASCRTDTQKHTEHASNDSLQRKDTHTLEHTCVCVCAYMYIPAGAPPGELQQARGRAEPWTDWHPCVHISVHRWRSFLTRRPRSAHTHTHTHVCACVCVCVCVFVCSVHDILVYGGVWVLVYGGGAGACVCHMAALGCASARAQVILGRYITRIKSLKQLRETCETGVRGGDGEMSFPPSPPLTPVLFLREGKEEKQKRDL